ncbi:hypothetical protein ANRL2_01976 [Anaerolineae bacterium]|nr:hypothetical protein ANRL2_01976 [Anaerolineae bacterium]
MFKGNGRTRVDAPFVSVKLLALQRFCYRDQIGGAGGRDGVLRQRFNLCDYIRELIGLDAGSERLLDGNRRVASIRNRLQPFK